MILYGIQNAGHPWSLQKLSEDELRFELRAGDVWLPTDANLGKERSEVYSLQNYPPGTVAVEYDLVVEPGPANTAQWLIIGQWHPIDTSPVPADCELMGENMAIVTRSVANPYTVLWRDTQPIVRGRRYHMHWRLQADPVNGAFAVWRDDVPLINFAGPIGSGAPMYWKNGLYREAAPETIAARYSNLIIR